MPTALHAEWTKLRTVAGPAWLLAALVTLTTTVSSLALAENRYPSGTACPVDTTKLSLTGVQLGQAVVAVLAVLVIGNEYSTGMIRVTLTALPRRTVMLAAKAAVLTSLVLAASLLAVAGSLLAGRLILPGQLSPDSPSVLRAGLGSVLYLALIALLSLGTATIVRESAVAVGIVLGLLYLFPIVANVVGNATWHRHLEQIGPMTAGLAIQATTGLRSLPISPWAGLGVLAAWAAGALLAGGLLLRLRDA
jgi:ABC-2 type transport system permease protein